MSLATPYTTTLPSSEMSAFHTLPGNLFLGEEEKPGEVRTISPSANVWHRLLWEYPITTSRLEPYREDFIGMLTDEEADKMREELKYFKKRFNDAFAKKHQILFGE